MGFLSADYCCQSLTVACFSAAASVVGLGAVGLGLWFVIYTEGFILVLGTPIGDVFVGYAALGGFMAVCGVIGSCASIARSIHLLAMYAVLLLGSVVCQGGVWAFIFLKRREVSAAMSKNIRLYYDRYSDVLSKEFSSCVLEGGQHGYQDAAVEACSSQITDWLWMSTWAALGLLIALMCIQLLLLVIALMLRQLLIDIKERDQVEFIRIEPEPLKEVELCPLPHPTPHPPMDGQPQRHIPIWLQNPFSPVESDKEAPPHQCTCDCHKYQPVSAAPKLKGIISF